MVSQRTNEDKCHHITRVRIISYRLTEQRYTIAIVSAAVTHVAELSCRSPTAPFSQYM